MEILIISSRTCRVQCEQPMMSDLITLHREFKVSLTSIGYQECLITSWQRLCLKQCSLFCLCPVCSFGMGIQQRVVALGLRSKQKFQHDLQQKIFPHHPAITKQVIEIWTKWCSHKIWNQSLPKHLLVTLTTGIWGRLWQASDERWECAGSESYESNNWKLTWCDSSCWTVVFFSPKCPDDISRF